MGKRFSLGLMLAAGFFAFACGGGGDGGGGGRDSGGPVTGDGGLPDNTQVSSLSVAASRQVCRDLATYEGEKVWANQELLRGYCSGTVLSETLDPVTSKEECDSEVSACLADLTGTSPFGGVEYCDQAQPQPKCTVSIRELTTCVEAEDAFLQRALPTLSCNDFGTPGLNAKLMAFDENLEQCSNVPEECEALFRAAF